MQVIRALSSHFTVSGCYSLAILPSFRVITGVSGKSALGFSETLLSLTEVSGIVHLLPVRQVSEMLKPYVNAYSLTFMGSWLFKLVLNREAGVPMGAVADNADRLHSPINRTVKLQLEGADPGEREPASQHRPTKLGIGQTIVSILTLKAWVSWGVAPPHTCKERTESLIYSMKHILKGLAVHVAKVGAYLLALDKS